MKEYIRIEKDVWEEICTWANGALEWDEVESGASKRTLAKNAKRCCEEVVRAQSAIEERRRMGR